MLLGVEQADGIKTMEVYEKVNIEIKRRMNLLTKSELNHENFTCGINMKPIPVAAYLINACKLKTVN